MKPSYIPMCSDMPWAICTMPTGVPEGLHILQCILFVLFWERKLKSFISVISPPLSPVDKVIITENYPYVNNFLFNCRRLLNRVSSICDDCFCRSSYWTNSVTLYTIFCSSSVKSGCGSKGSIMAASKNRP